MTAPLQTRMGTADFIADFMQTVKMNLRLNDKYMKYADVKQRDEEGSNALYWAIMHGNAYNTLLLLEAGCPLEVSPGKPALHFAIECKSPSILLMLLDHGVNVNCQDCNGKTPLMCAIEQEDETLVKYLLYKNASTTIADHNNRYASDYVEQCNNIQIQQFIYDEIFFRAG